MVDFSNQIWYNYVCANAQTAVFTTRLLCPPTGTLASRNPRLHRSAAEVQGWGGGYSHGVWSPGGNTDFALGGALSLKRPLGHKEARFSNYNAGLLPLANAPICSLGVDIWALTALVASIISYGRRVGEEGSQWV